MEKTVDKDTIIALAREAGCHASVITGAVCFNPDVLERFVALVAAHEREHCAKLFEGESANMMTKQECAAAIRARNVDSVYTSPERVEKTAESIRISQPHRYAGSFGD